MLLSLFPGCLLPGGPTRDKVLVHLDLWDPGVQKLNNNKSFLSLEELQVKGRGGAPHCSASPHGAQAPEHTEPLPGLNSQKHLRARPRFALGGWAQPPGCQADQLVECCRCLSLGSLGSLSITPGIPGSRDSGRSCLPPQALLTLWG